MFTPSSKKRYFDVKKKHRCKSTYINMNLFKKSAMIRSLLFFSSFLGLLTSCYGQPSQAPVEEIETAASQLDLYLPLLEGKSVALIVNQTSLIDNTHLVDTLLSRGVTIKKVFAPEHGFRGEADAGETIKSAVDVKTGLPIISLYGKNKKPTAEQIADIDIIIFDIQDVGTRFYTYISTMHYAMEACAENSKKMLILDRPNPNGHYVDGPILEPEFASFVGMHPIPVVHGLTVGELALMINGEKWLKGQKTCEVEIIKVKNYTHDSSYVLPVRPSPNLPNQQSVLLYPSICFFEGTPGSLGRGTDFPFQVIGFPDPVYGTFEFTPVSKPGATSPPNEGKKCYGVDLRNETVPNELDLQYLIYFYNKSPRKDAFFTDYFKLLAGTEKLQKQISSGMSEEKIKETWKKPLENYNLMREKYLLYP